MKSICIIRLGRIDRDARTLREISSLYRDFDINVIQLGRIPSKYANNPKINWITLGNGNYDWHEPFITRIQGFLLLLLGKIVPRSYDKWFWSKKIRIEALEVLSNLMCDLIFANDWDTLPIAVRAAQVNGAKILYDAPEYSINQFEQYLSWRLLRSPAIDWILKKYGPKADEMITISSQFVQRYKKDYGFDMHVVMSASERVELPDPKPVGNHIRIVHSGAADPRRRIELMIDMIAMCDDKFSLYFYLVPRQPGYIEYLKDYAQIRAPGRVFFMSIVEPEEVVREISQYDLGVFLLPPNSYNHEFALPNKFFDYANAGLGIVISPNPAMAEFVREYSCGVIASDFSATSMSLVVNSLTDEQILDMKKKSRELSIKINNETEMLKVKAIIHNLLFTPNS